MAEFKEATPNLECLERLPASASELVQLDPGHLGLTSFPGFDKFRSAWARQLHHTFHDGCPVNLDVGS
jgi:hypothetical protein